MRPSMWRRASVVGVLIAVVVLFPAGSQAGLLDCLWGGGAGGAAQTTCTPRYVAPTTYYPTSSTTPVGPFARLRAALRSTPAPIGTTCYYVPQVSYRQVVEPTAATSYVPVVTRDACTGCTVTAYQPVTTYSNEVRLVPYTTYRLVCTKAQYAPAVYTTPTCSPVQPTAYMAAPAAVSSGCTTCVPSTTYYYAPAISTSPASAGVSYPAAQPTQSTLPAGNFSVPSGASSFGSPSSSSGLSGTGATTTYGKNGWAGNGSSQPAGATPPAASGAGTSYAPSANANGGTSSGASSGGTSGGNGFRTGTGWPLRPGAVPLPSQLQQPSSNPMQESPPRSAPIENLQSPPVPAGPALTDPGDKTALLPPLVARSGEPVRGRLVPVERLQIPVDNNSAVEKQTVGGAWSVVRN